MTLRIIDIETTGTNPNDDAVVEIASCDAARDSKPTNPMSRLVNPGRPIPAESSAVHHLTDVDVRNAPVFSHVIDEFAGSGVYVAHNADFESSFLSDALQRPKWLCTYKCALRLWPDLPTHSNQGLRYIFGYRRPWDMSEAELTPHRALPDCFVTACVLREVLREANEQGTTFAELLEWSQQPALISVFRFGKHKGQRLDAVPRDYLEWISEKSDMDASAKFSARYWLNNVVKNEAAE